MKRILYSSFEFSKPSLDKNYLIFRKEVSAEFD